MFEKDEKKLLKWLVEQEIKKFEDESGEIRPLVPQFLAIEEEYDQFLKKVLEKLDKI
ncbi:MAG: hypothetical protein KJ574_02420 [Nanoarchaeota archaeon]|nr:hypothetical protein [Nanoarchaeota archaeon]